MACLQYNRECAQYSPDLSWPARVCLAVRNSLVKEVKFLGLILQKWYEIGRLGIM